MGFTRGGVIAHSATTSRTATDHHTATVAADLNLAGLNARAHTDLSDAPASAHHNAEVKIVKAANETRTSTVTQENDDAFTFSVGANEDWLVIQHLRVSGLQNGGGMRMTWSVPAGATPEWNAVGVALNNAATVVVLATTENNSTVFATGAAALNVQEITIYTYIDMASTAGTAVWQWAQETSDGDAITVLAGSWMVAHRV